MKKRILATLVVVAMVVGVCTVVSAEDTLTPIFEENFEGENVSISNVNGAEGADEVTTDPNGTNKAWKIVGGNNSFTTNYLVNELDATKEYTVVVRVLGDCGHLVVGDFNEFWQQFDAAAVESRHGVDLGWTIVSQDWAWHYAKVTGVTQISLTGIVQGDMAIMGNILYIDDVKIYEGDKVEEVKAELEGATPVVSEEPVDPDETATAGTDATATAGTDATATAGTDATATAGTDATATATAGTTATATMPTTPSPTPGISNISGNFQYEIIGNSVSITKYLGKENIVDIPEKINNRTVVSIGESAFKNNEVIQSVIFPDTIEEIGAKAFESCALLSNVSFKENLKLIGNYAFFNCKALTMVIIPESVTSIGQYAFGYDSSYNAILGFTITGFGNTVAEQYANNQGLNFNSLGESVAIPVKSVKFNKKSIKIKKGKKATLKVTIKGAKKATFSVDKKGKKVVKLSKKKAKSVVVTGKKKGKATITAKAAGKKATCKVTVR